MASSIAAPVARVTATPAVAKQQQQQQQQRKHVTATRLVSRRTVVTPKAVDANVIVQLADGLDDIIPTVAVVASVVRRVAWDKEGMTNIHPFALRYTREPKSIHAKEFRVSLSTRLSTFLTSSLPQEVTFFLHKG